MIIDKQTLEIIKSVECEVLREETWKPKCTTNAGFYMKIVWRGINLQCLLYADPICVFVFNALKLCDDEIGLFFHVRG